LNGVDTFSGNIEAISAITPADVQAFMSQFLKDGFYHVYTLDPETAE
jgi:predicted Zn-dependent peptidase